MNAKRGHFAAAFLDGLAFAIGGRTQYTPGQAALSAVETLNVHTGKWTSVAPLISARAYLAAATLGGHVYAIAGTDENRHALSSVERYDVEGDVWTLVDELPVARRGLAAVTVGDCIYAMGGSGTASAYKYCLDNRRWVSIASMLTARGEHAAAALDGKAYTCGGWQQGERLALCEVYDPVTDEWSEFASLPSGRKAFALTAADGALYAFGGHDGNGFLSDTLRYSPASDTWTSVAGMPTARRALAAVTIPSAEFV